MTDEFYILDAYTPENDFSQIAYASYEIRIHTAGASDELADRVKNALTTAPINMIKKGKAGEREIDIVPLIKSVDAAYDGENKEILIKTVLSASSSQYLNPEMLISALKERTEILSGDPTLEYYSIMRTELKKEDMSEFS